MSEKREKRDLVAVLAPAIGMVILAACILGFFLLSGQDVSVEQVLLIVGAVATVFGFGVRSLRNGSGNGGAAAGGLMLLVIGAAFLGGCGAPMCATERATVHAVGNTVDVIEPLMSMSRGDEVVQIARAVVDLGAGAVQACELERDGEAFDMWLRMAGQMLLDIIAIAEHYEIELPDSVLDTIRLIAILLE